MSDICPFPDLHSSDSFLAKSLLTRTFVDAIIHVQCFCNGREVRNDDAYDVHAYDDLCHRGVLSFKQLKPI